jgi:RPM1-interacting protein 4
MWQQRSHVPQFGNWESGDNVPYTVYFDKARKGRGGGKMVNPNDPEENPDLFSDNSSSAQGPTSRAIAEPEEPIRQKPGRSSHEQRRSREDGDLKQFTDNLGGRDNSEPPNHRHGGRGVSSGETHRRPARNSAGSEHIVERSPLHRQAKVPARDGGVNSYSFEGKASYESAHGTPGRSRMKPETRGDETVILSYKYCHK